MLESQLQTIIIDRLKTLQKLNKLYYIRVNAGTMLGGRLKLGQPGISDLIIFTRIKPLFVELKGDHGHQSDVQKVFEIDIKRLGYEYFVISALEKFDDLIKQYI